MHLLLEQERLLLLLLLVHERLLLLLELQLQLLPLEVELHLLLLELLLHCRGRVIGGGRIGCGCRRREGGGHRRRDSHGVGGSGCRGDRRDGVFWRS